MFETAGTLTIVELASSLVALVLLPLFWAAVAAVAVAARLGRSLRGARGHRDVGRDARSRRRACHSRVADARGARRASSTSPSSRASVSSTSRSISSATPRPRRSPCSSRSWRSPRCSTPCGRCLRGIAARLAWTGLAASATLLVVLADGLPALAVGLQMATLAGWAMAGGGRARPLGLALAGDTAVVFVAWILFWSLGGTFGASGYTPDPQPRFAHRGAPRSGARRRQGDGLAHDVRRRAREPVTTGLRSPASRFALRSRSRSTRATTRSASRRARRRPTSSSRT